jgi:hypothetical protein
MKTLMLVILLTGSCFARIGETKETCIARYGPALKDAIDEDKDAYTVHQKAGFKIVINYWKGKAASIGFIKAEKDELDRSVEISEEEIQLILRNNNQGKDWKKVPLVWLDKKWEIDSSNAIYHFESRMLYLITKEYELEREKRKAEAEKKNLQGF